MFNYAKSYNPTHNQYSPLVNIGPFRENLSGEQPHIGRINALWVNPANFDHIVVGTNNAGIWKTTNGGQTWDHKTASQWFGVHDFDYDATRGILYAATGVYANGLIHHSKYGMGIYQSTDLGETWTSLHDNILPEDEELIHALLVTTDGQKMFKLAGGGFYVSTNQGLTFTLISGVWGRFINQNPVNPNQICVSGHGQFFVSNDKGVTWVSKYEQVMGLVPEPTGLFIAADYSNTGTLWINATRISGNFPNHSDVLKSANNGATWSTTCVVKEQVGAMLGGSVYIRAFTDNDVFVGGGSLSKLTENGSEITPSTYYQGTIVHADIRDMSMPDISNPDLVYVVTDGGINKSITGGLPRESGWTQIYGNLALNECYTISQNNTKLLIGTHDDGTYKGGYLGGNTAWEWFDFGDGGATCLHQTSLSTFLWRSGGSLYWSDQAGDNPVLIPNMGGNYDSPVLAHPTIQGTAFAVTSQVGGYSIISKSTNFKDFPYNSSDPIAGSYGWAWGQIKSLNVPIWDINTLFYIANGQNFFSIYKKALGNGIQGTNISFNMQSILVQDNVLIAKITSITTHPTDQNIAWVSIGNFAAGKKVYQLNQEAQTWTNISYNLPNIPVNKVKYYQPTNTLFVATDAGLFQLTNALPLGSNQNWERYPDFPFVIASDIQINGQGDMVVATYGRGVWKANLNCLSDTQVLTINENTTWPASKAVSQTVEIMPGKTLTIGLKVVVSFPPDAKIVIRPGAKLDIKGGAVLTSSCGQLWQGIVLIGNKNLCQTLSNQPKLVIATTARIENAKYGVYVGDPTNPGLYGGGIVNATSSVFYNCEVGVQMDAYKNFAPQNPSTEINNLSSFQYVTFTTDKNYLKVGDKPYAHIVLNGVKGVGMIGNHINNVNPESFSINNRGYGVLLKEAIVTIGGTGFNTFTGLSKAIYNLATTGFSDIQVLNNRFYNNYIGIEMSGTYKGKASGNTIELLDDGYFGFFMNNLEHFRIENNSITGNGSKIGMVVQNSTMANEIYKNTFNNLGTAFYGYSNPNLKLTCNTFNNNLYQINTANDGISPNQGTMLMSAGNVFIPDCSGTTNELNATEINYKKLSYFYFNNPLADEEPLCHNDNVRLYETTAQNGCSSKEPSEPEVLEARYQELNSSIGQQENNLAQLVDGGSTPKTVNAIENVNEGQEINLMTDLMDKSPFLSEEALVKTAVEEDVLPAIIVANVLEANPQAAKSVEVQTALDNRANPMPDYLRQMIDQGLDVVSAKEELEMALGENKMRKEQVLSDIITAYLNDETTDRSADAEALMLAENSASYDYLMVNRYLSTNRMAQAQTLFNAMPGKYGFSDAQMAEYNQMAQIVAIHVALGHANYFELTAEQKAQLYLLAEDGATRAGALARGILVLVDRAEFPVPEITIPEGGNKNQRIPTEEKPVFSFTVQPNPANDYFVVEYNLATKDFETAELRLFNNQGKQVYQQKLTKQAFQLLITTEQFELGIYLCRLYKDNKEIAANPLVIKPNQLTNPQAVVQAEQLLEGQQFFLVYPNPTTVDVTVCSSRTENCTIEVYDERGQVVNRQTKVAATNTINTRGLKPGVYHVRLVENGKVVETVKLVVQ